MSFIAYRIVSVVESSVSIKATTTQAAKVLVNDFASEDLSAKEYTREFIQALEQCNNGLNTECVIFCADLMVKFLSK